MEALTRQVAEGGRRSAEAEEGSGDDVDEEIGYASPRSLQWPFVNPFAGADCGDRRHRTFRVNLPEFSGSLSAEEFVDWLDRVERIFEYKDTPEEECVAAVAM